MKIEQLKAKAYDLISQLEKVQRELNEVNQQIRDFKETNDATKTN